MLVKTQQFGFRSLITGVYIVHWHNLAGSVIMTKCALLLTNFRRVSLCLTVRAFLPGLETLFCRGYTHRAPRRIMGQQSRFSLTSFIRVLEMWFTRARFAWQQRSVDLSKFFFRSLSRGHHVAMTGENTRILCLIITSSGLDRKSVV